MTDDIRIYYVNASELKPNERNARLHSGPDVETIKASIEQFGFLDPIGVWGKDNLIVEGHGRLEAAKLLGMEEVPIIRLDMLTDEQRRAYALAHNKTAELSKWDTGNLMAELDRLEDEYDMTAFGFSQTNLAAMDDLFGTDGENDDGDKPNDDNEPEQIQCPYCGMWFTP